MANMSHCRFFNTYQNLQDCIDHMSDEGLSDEEEFYREQLVELCRNVVDDYDIEIDEQTETAWE